MTASVVVEIEAQGDEVARLVGETDAGLAAICLAGQTEEPAEEGDGHTVMMPWGSDLSGIRAMLDGRVEHDIRLRFRVRLGSPHCPIEIERIGVAIWIADPMALGDLAKAWAVTEPPEGTTIN